MSTSFQPVKQSRTSDAILSQVKEAIVTGQFSPGEKLPSERELTEAFQVSRVVVREAVRALELSGFVDIRQGPRGGAYVKELGYDRLFDGYYDLFLAGRVSANELVQVRRLLEPEAARLAAENITAEQAERLTQALEAETIPRPTHQEWVDRNIVVDFILAEASGNRLFRATLEPLLRLTRELVLAVKPERTVIHAHAEHAAIVEAVLAGDSWEAEERTRAHLDRVGDRLIELERLFREKLNLPAVN